MKKPRLIGAFLLKTTTQNYCFTIEPVQTRSPFLIDTR
jgi:hypothetical protein